MDIKKSEIKHILDERRHERTMEKVGIITFTFLMTLAVIMLVHAYFISLTLR